MVGTISLATGVATDIVTAGALCYFLNKLRTGYTTFVLSNLSDSDVLAHLHI